MIPSNIHSKAQSRLRQSFAAQRSNAPSTSPPPGGMNYSAALQRRNVPAPQRVVIPGNAQQPRPLIPWLLVVQWPPSRGYSLNFFSVHGVFFENGEPNEKIVDPTIDDFENALGNKLREIMRDLKHGSTDYTSFLLWLHEWKFHGKFSGLNVKEFFKKIIFLYNKLPKTDQVIGQGKQGYRQDFTLFRQRVSGCINGKTFGISGFNYGGVPHVLEMKYMMDRDSGQFMDVSNCYSGEITSQTPFIKFPRHTKPLGTEAMKNH